MVPTKFTVVGRVTKHGVKSCILKRQIYGVGSYVWCSLRVTVTADTA